MMPTGIEKKSIAFENNHEAIAVLPAPGAKGADIISTLGITGYKAVLLLIGGADSLDEKLNPQLTKLFEHGVARATATINAVIIDGGTQAGVMAMMGQGVADRGFKSPLVGVAPLAMVHFPGSDGKGETPLDPNHTHFVLVKGHAWGSETNVIFKLVNALRSSKVPAVVLLVGGGTVTRREALQAVRQNLPLFVVEGSGGVADEIAAAWKARPALPDDRVLAEIITDGRIELYRLDKLVRAAERLLFRALGGDNVLLQSWGHFADYDLNAILQQKRFHRLHIAIIVIGVLGTALALTKQVFNPGGVQTGLRNWWFFRPWPWTVRTDHWVGWWLSYYLLLIIPILITLLITVANRFKQGNKWLLLRDSAEAIKREIFRYRTRSGDYKEPPPPAPGTSAAPPAPDLSQPPEPNPEQVLAQRVEDITRRLMRTEVNASALKPYDRDKGLPPYIYATQGGDDGFSVLTADRYIEIRLADQLNYFRTRAVKHERRLKVIQWSTFVIGGLGSLLAAINRQVWIALTTAMAAALTAYLNLEQTEITLTKYNQAATDLSNIKAWWTALPREEQAKQANVDALVDHTEQVLQSELEGWVQQMQNTLAELRKGQAQAIEREPGIAPTAEVTAGGQIVGEGETPADETTTDQSTAGEEIVGEGETSEGTAEPVLTTDQTTTDEETEEEQPRGDNQ
jgi:SLOG in TRPM, prokaryote/SMODS and SLOG-associating 2TM effector domain 1/Protein of unknown function (DUF4231)